MATKTLKFTQTIEAPTAAVYHAFTNATALREWLCDSAQVKARKGGCIHLSWHSGYYATGEFTGLRPSARVAFTWRGRGEPAETLVRVLLTEADGVTTIRLSHEGVGTTKAWGSTSDEVQKGWLQGLENLRSVLETGHDVRFTRRPMLGIFPEPLDEEAAARLGVPTTEGILLGGVVEGMGAEAAGLAKGDVVVRLGGRKTPDGAALETALRGRRAGDEVRVAYYRGPERLTTAMTLSGRPIEEPPATAPALAAAVAEAGREFAGRLEAALEGATEEEAGHRPEPGEWSAKEVLCHLIVGERETHTWINGLVGAQEPWIDEWPGNLDIRHTGLLVAFPTVGALLEELRRNRAETHAMLAALPEAFVARKGSYWRLGFALLEGPWHNEAHLEQIRAAIAAARTGR